MHVACNILLYARIIIFHDVNIAHTAPAADMCRLRMREPHYKPMGRLYANIVINYYYYILLLYIIHKYNIIRRFAGDHALGS